MLELLLIISLLFIIFKKDKIPVHKIGDKVILNSKTKPIPFFWTPQNNFQEWNYYGKGIAENSEINGTITAIYEINGVKIYELTDTSGKPAQIGR